MKCHRNWLTALIMSLALGAAACSDDTSSGPAADGGVGDAGVADLGEDMGFLPDGYQLWPCNEPGTACNAHDPCAINPICGPDKLCRPSALQNCDDGLDCTTDVCLGLGQCSNAPKQGFCALPVKVEETSSGGGLPQTVMRCFSKDERSPNDPCVFCDPDTDPSKWQPANGGTCDDGNDCTKDDYCQSGVCKGTYYGNVCADNYGCTDDLCDGKGGCLGNVLKSDWCLISGVCYKDGQADSTGCKRCDVSQSQSAWTVLTDFCLIGGKCYAPGETDSTKCNVCDPSKSTTSWTAVAGVCFISGACYQPGDKHTGGCAECYPTSSATSWTVKGDDCLIANICKKPGDKDATGCQICDPTKNKYAWTQLSDVCFIGGKCYQPAQQNPVATCAECDPAVSSTGWTVKVDQCFIDGKCLAPGALDSTKCASCEPASSKYGWTPLPDMCLIAGICYADGAKDTTGCLMCSYAAQPQGWTPVPGVSVASHDFESGTAPGWTLSNSSTTVGWQVSSKRAATGTYSLYYGNPSTGNYDDGDHNYGSASLPPVTLAAGKKAGLTFMLYPDVEDDPAWDVLEVRVTSGATQTTVWKKHSSAVFKVKMKVWQEVSISLSQFAGQTVTIELFFDTLDHYVNTSEGIYIDDVTLYHDC